MHICSVLNQGVVFLEDKAGGFPGIKGGNGNDGNGGIGIGKDGGGGAGGVKPGIGGKLKNGAGGGCNGFGIKGAGFGWNGFGSTGVGWNGFGGIIEGGWNGFGGKIKSCSVTIGDVFGLNPTFFSGLIFVLRSFEFLMLGFSLHRFGCFRGLNVKNPAENMCIPCFLDLRWSEDEVADEATAQYGSLLLINFTEHPSIVFTCLLTEKGKWTLNSPCLSVFTSFRKLGFVFPSLHSTATFAPAYTHKPQNSNQLLNLKLNLTVNYMKQLCFFF